jgi:hypothetical protein
LQISSQTLAPGKLIGLDMQKQKPKGLAKSRENSNQAEVLP